MAEKQVKFFLIILSIHGKQKSGKELLSQVVKIPEKVRESILDVFMHLY